MPVFVCDSIDGIGGCSAQMGITGEPGLDHREGWFVRHNAKRRGEDDNGAPAGGWGGCYRLKPFGQFNSSGILQAGRRLAGSRRGGPPTKGGERLREARGARYW